MTENETKISTIAEDYKMVLHEAKSMGCNDIRALYHIPIKNMKLIVQALEEIQQYRAIGTVEECRAAVEKQTAKLVINNTPTEDGVWYQCPTCKGDLTSIRGFYCGYCGQKLDWSDEE